MRPHIFYVTKQSEDFDDVAKFIKIKILYNYLNKFAYGTTKLGKRKMPEYQRRY